MLDLYNIAGDCRNSCERRLACSITEIETDTDLNWKKNRRRPKLGKKTFSDILIKLVNIHSADAFY